MKTPIPIAVAHGDGIGPEICNATLMVLKESGASLEIHPVEIGEKVYLRGQKAGIDPETWTILRETKAFLKAPITTPQGGGYKSLNVTVRASLGLYANVRPCVSYYPFVSTKHPLMDLVIIRENEEDLYMGIEYRQTKEVFQAMKVITKSGSERIVRYAFEYALAHGRKKVSCFTKDNILKLTDGTFHKIFEEIALEYPQIDHEHWIVDIGAAKLADKPEEFDVIVLPNLYGDILSDVAAQIAGSVGLAGSANIGLQGAMFEAIHGSAPRRAGQNVANPSGLLLAAVMMLHHIGEEESASRIHNAWLKTIEDGIHTYDIFKENVSKEKVGTEEFAKAVIQRLGKLPQKLKSMHSQPKHRVNPRVLTYPREEKELHGVDVYIDSEWKLDELRKVLERVAKPEFKLSMISNREVRVYPGGIFPEANCVDLWRCRFVGEEKGKVTHRDVVELLRRLTDENLDFTSIEHLYFFDGKPGYTVAQEEQ